MAAEAEQVYKDRDTIVAELASSWQARVPQVVLTPDSIIRIWIEVAASTIEGLMLANQLLHDDMFPQTANALALLRYGELYGRPIKSGTKSIGTIRFGGAGGTVIPLGTTVAAPGTLDDPLHFVTTSVVTIPNPGDATAPVATVGGAGALAAGTYEYAVTFVTAEGETELGAASTPLVKATTNFINIANIPVGGPGTIARRLYRRVDGGAWQQVTAGGVPAALANNTTTSVGDGNAVPGGGAPPSESTAERITVAAESAEEGIEYNAQIGTITELVDAVSGIADVTNLVAFTGGSDEEDIETYRDKVVEYIRAPASGAPADLEVWAEAIDGVEDASVFPNDNMGVATNGHTTVRISGPGGSIPSGAVIAAVLADLQARDLANIQIHVATFTPKVTNVTVTITLATGYLLAEVTPSVQEAIRDYINGIPVGGTVYTAGLIDAIFGLPGVATVVVNLPAADVGSTATEKPTPGTLIVN
jgi:uncharacterized phage protein gp47/JayE